MKKLLLNTAIFFVPLILFMFLADLLFSHYLRNSRDGEYSVWNDIYDGKVNADVVIYGSSRAMVHFNPAVIRDSLHVNAYNLGINGHNFWLQYFRHKQLMKNNKAPRFVIHSVDVFTLVKRKDLFEMEQFLPYMLYNAEMKSWISSYQGFKSYDYYIPLVRYYGQAKTMKRIFKYALTGRNSVDSARTLGYKHVNLTWNDDLDRARQKYADYRVTIDTATVRLFDKYLQEMAASHIPVVLVYTPEYIEGQTFVKNREEIIQVFRLFAEKYNLAFLDYSNDPISHDKAYFYNASHLNGRGAEAFTSKIIGDLKKSQTITREFLPTNDTEVHQASLILSKK